MEVSPAGLTDPATLVMTAILLAGLSGLPGLLLKGRSGIGQPLATLLLGLGSLLGLAGALAILATGRTAARTVAWGLPFGPCEIAVDPLSALFLLPVFLIAACAAIYATGYWPARENPGSEPQLTFFFGLLAAAMAMLLVARNGVLFLIAWEVMALASFFLLVVDNSRREVREAGIVYLVVTHVGTLALFILFTLLRGAAGSFRFPEAASLDAAAVPAAAIFLAALIGFGAKAGLMPLHIWLPAAHANAPSHVSAVMSGVMLKMGLYGIIRVVSFFRSPPLSWGITLLIGGVVSALLGIVFAMAQRDLKRLLACSSIENVGIITIGLGVGLIGRSSGNPLIFLLGTGGALFHLLNHSLFKPLLFFGSGSIIHAAGTREIDLLGGLARRLPWTALLFITGTVAICGLPPLNGFAGEFLLYLAFFADARGGAVPYLALLAPLLALVGGLALLCFVRLYATAFLGLPRSERAAAGHEAGWAMLLPMGVLALICLLAGLWPQGVLGLLRPALYSLAPGLPLPAGGVATWARLAWISAAGLALLLLVGMLALWLRSRLRGAPLAAGQTWGCGYLAPRATMQYTGSSFAAMMVGFFGKVVRPRCTTPAVEGVFPERGKFRCSVPDTLLELLILPLFRGADLLFSLFRKLQHGELQLYMLYMFVTLFLLMAWGH